MASGVFYPAVSGDDGHWWAGAWLATGNSLYLGHYGVTAYKTFIRFVDVTIPQGAIITSAVLWVHSNDSDSDTPCTVSCYFNAVDNATALSGTDDPDLTSPVEWNISDAWVAFTWHYSVDLKTILQDVVDRGGWASGNAAQIIIDDNSSTYHRQVSSIDHYSGAYKAELRVEWTPFLQDEEVATWNPSDRGSDTTVNKSSLLVAEKGSVVSHSGVRSNYSKTTGLWYFEVAITSGDDHYVGVATEDADLDKSVGGDDFGWSYCSDGTKRHGDNAYVCGEAYAPGDVIGVALDATNREVWFSRNGIWQGGGNPEAGTNPAFSGLSGAPFYAIWSSYYAG